MNYSSPSHQTKINSALREELESIIDSAIRKVNGSKENDLCKYLPISTGGYIHHFTLRKMKTEEPEELISLIKEKIIDVDYPETVSPKPRAPRGSRKQRGQIYFTKNELDKMLVVAKEVGFQDIVAKLTPKKSLAACKKELIASIKLNKVDQNLWQSYMEAIESYMNANQLVSNAASHQDIYRDTGESTFSTQEGEIRTSAAGSKIVIPYNTVAASRPFKESD